MKVYNKKVHNGPIGKVLRTFGYLFILIGSLLLASDVLAVLNIGFINNYLLQLNTFLTANFSQVLLDLKYLYVIAGLLLLIFTLGRKIATKILLSLLILFTAININLTGAFYFPNMVGKLLTLNINLSGLITLLNQTVNANDIVSLVINLLTPFLAYILIASKKPKRIASNLVSASLMLLTLVFIFYALPMLLTEPFFTTSIYLNIRAYVVALTAVLPVLGSVFGILGMFRR